MGLADFSGLFKSIFFDRGTGKFHLFRGAGLFLKAWIYYYLLNRKIANADYAEEYNTVAPTYSRWMNRMGKYTDNMITLDYIDKQSEDVRILDLACGQGYISRRILEKWDREERKNLLLTGVDVSEEMLSVCRNEINDDRVKFIKSDGITFLAGVEDNTYDAVYFGWALPYFKYRILLKHLYRILTPGGTAALITNCTGTLSGLEEVFVETLAQHPDKINKIIDITLQLPGGLEGLCRWFGEFNFSCLETGEGEEEVFQDSLEELYLWLRQTGVLAGTYNMFLDTKEVEQTLIKKLAERRKVGERYMINHKFVYGFFKKEG